MDDQVLIQILETACAEENLIFQVIEQEGYLHIFLNRESAQTLEYRIVGKKIYRALSRLTLTDIDGVYLYSRILGEEEPDWETRFRLPQATAQVNAQANASVPGVQAASEAAVSETASESERQSEPVAQFAGVAQSETQRQISEADTFIVRGGDTAIGTQAGGLGKPGRDLRSRAQPAIADDAAVATAAHTQNRAARTTTAPAPEASQYPLSDPDGAAEAAAAYEAAETAAPTVSVVAESAVSAGQARKKQDGSAASEANFDLTQHCFIRNRMLLTSDIVPPSKTVAEQISTFHELPMAQKQRMMPQLELFFKGAPTFSAAELSEAQQTWFKSAQALTKDDVRKLPIWLSRYCLDSEAALEVIARVLDPSLAVKQAETSETEATPEGPQDHGARDHHGAQGPSTQAPRTNSQNARAQNLSTGGAAHSISGAMAGRPAESQRSSGPMRTQPSRTTQAPAEEASTLTQWLWPGIVVIGSVILMGLGMLLAKPAAIANLPACSASTAPEKCQLAAQIIGPELFDDIEDGDYIVTPLPTVQAQREEQLNWAGANCNISAAINAGHSYDDAIQKSIQPLKRSVQEVAPGVVLADIEHKSLEGADSVRTACVLANEAWSERPADVELSLISAPIIPTDWPTEAYDNSEQEDAELRVERAFHPLFTIGSTLLFTTVGLFAAALLRMAVVAHNLTALSQAAIAMSIFEAFFELLLPLNGLLMFPFIVARKSLALGLTGAVIPGFKVDWSGGYASVSGCVAVMVFVRFVLRWLMILTILGGI